VRWKLHRRNVPSAETIWGNIGWHECRSQNKQKTQQRNMSATLAESNSCKMKYILYQLLSHWTREWLLDWLCLCLQVATWEDQLGVPMESDVALITNGKWRSRINYTDADPQKECDYGKQGGTQKHLSQDNVWDGICNFSMQGLSKVMMWTIRTGGNSQWVYVVHNAQCTVMSLCCTQCTMHCNEFMLYTMHNAL
jgi:hypothetical protein